MHLNQEERDFMVSILRTMIYNSIDDLKTKLIDNKNLLSKEKYNLLLYGNEYLLNDTKIRQNIQYKVIKELITDGVLIVYYNIILIEQRK